MEPAGEFAGEPAVAAAVREDDDARDVPVSVRGRGLHFERAAQACLFSGDTWLVGHSGEFVAAQTLARFTPTFVTGAMRVQAGKLPDPDTIRRWNSLRFLLQQANSLVGFDMTLDLRSSTDPAKLREAIRALGALLSAEAWTFEGADAVNASLVAAAVEEAHAQGRKVGLALPPEALAGAGPFSGEAAWRGQDYNLVCYGDGKQLERRVSAMTKAMTAAVRRPVDRAGTGGTAGGGSRLTPPLPTLVVSGASFARDGGGFARGKTPAQRRLTVKNAAQTQTNDLWYAYPVYGPLAAADKTYDASRDEFMLDAIERAVREKNPIAPPCALDAAAL